MESIKYLHIREVKFNSKEIISRNHNKLYFDIDVIINLFQLVEDKKTILY